MDKLTISEIIKKNLALNLSPFKSLKIGAFKLKRSQIPKEDCERIVFYLDKESHVHLSAKALELGLTSDELLRQLTWSL